MAKFSMTCTCGHVMEVDAESREEAVQKMKDQMTPEAVKAHMDEFHQGEAPLTQEQVFAGIEAGMQPA